MARASQHISHLSRFTRYLIVLGAVGALLITNLVGLAMATLPGSSFNGADGVIPGDDGDLNLVDMACGSGDDDFPLNGASTKLNVIHDDAPPTMNVGTLGTGKADLCQVWMNTETSGDDFFLYLAWERATDNGTTVVFWEFQQNELACTSTAADCNPFAGRQTGDFLLVYDFEGGDARIYMRIFNGTSFGPTIDLVDAGFAEAELSAGDDTLRGEGVVNLADAGILDPASDECESFAGVIPGTVTGNSDTADYKDVILTDQQPGITNCGSIEVTKEVTGGDDFGAEFPIELSNGGSIHDEALGHGESYTVNDLFDDETYTLTEDLTGLDGWSIDSIVCSDGSESGADETELTGIEVVAGETTTCTVTNTPDLPTITLEKTADGDDIAESDFQASLNGGDVDWDVATEVNPDDHTIAEAIADGSDVQASWFEAGDWSCDNGDSGAAGGATVSVGLGDDVICSITNTQLPTTLTLHKIVDGGDGGDETQDDFQARIDGNPVDWDDAVDVTALDEHTASEDPVLGWTPGTWTGDCAADGTVTLDPGEDGECTITNDDDPSMVTVLKDVTNDDGGDAEAGDFDLLVDGGSHSHGDDVVVLSNTDVEVDENDLPGYEQTGISCDDGTSIDGDGSVTLNLDEGEHVTCTVFNDDIAPTITVVKEVINDDGGDAEAGDFALFLDGNSVTTGTTNTTTSNEAHEVSETLVDGYAQVSLTCVDDDTQTELAHPITLDEGQSATCTIVNDDLAPGLTVFKQVINDDGATAVPADFTLLVNGDAYGHGDTVDVEANTDYVVGEEILPGYVLVDIECTDGTSLEGDTGTVTVNLEEGEAVGCTLVNDDLPAAIIVVKDATDGVTATEDGLVVSFDPNDGDDETVTYTYVVTNTGDVTLTNVTLVDDILGPIELSDTTLDPGESITVTAVHVVTEDDGAQIVNIATVAGTPIHGGPDVSDDDPETVNVIEVLPQIIPEPEPELPQTGADAGRMAAWAMLLLILGAGAIRAESRWTAKATARR